MTRPTLVMRVLDDRDEIPSSAGAEAYGAVPFCLFHRSRSMLCNTPQGIQNGMCDITLTRASV